VRDEKTRSTVNMGVGRKDKPDGRGRMVYICTRQKEREREREREV
jgi:hypothetical protein